MAKPAKLPPFGKLLIERQRFKNLPFLVFICVGAGAWEAAKARNQGGDTQALVMPTESPAGAYTWPVQGCLCVVEWHQPAPDQMIVELVKALLRAGAESVAVWPRWVDYSKPGIEYDASLPAGRRWIQTREMIRVYRPPRKEAARAA
jgi:hypothetical protein